VDGTQTLQVVSGDNLLVQSKRTNSLRDDVATRLIDAQSGAQLLMTRDIGTLASVRGTRAVLLQEKPYSTATLVELVVR
jgi:hypothetical protein